MSAAHDLFAASSTPSITEFDPRHIPWQFRLTQDLRTKWDYSKGRVHEFLMSGSVGSAKSILLAHLGITHSLQFPGSRGALCRRTMPDLKRTILTKLQEHIGNDLREGKDYEFNRTSGTFTLDNNSQIICYSWADKNFKKARSLELSWAGIEELTENSDDFKGFYPELRMRVGRLPHVPENWIGCATNPDAPSHWAYKYFIESSESTRHVYYSITEDNPFLPPEYVAQLKRDLDPKMARRMLQGEWLEISAEVVYHQYDRALNFRDQVYEFNTRYPILLCFDFNIGVGKPMSAVAGQFIDDVFHWGENFIVEGARTDDLMQEIAARGLFDLPTKFYVHGDASGKNRDTRSKVTDYEIIRDFLVRYTSPKRPRVEFEIQVPLANPPVRARHNTVNGYIHNSLGQRRMFVYRLAKTLDEGFRLTKLKPGGQYIIEDDTPHYQHVTTAVGYGVVAQTLYAQKQSSSRNR
jgi:hypothetical protein